MTLSGYQSVKHPEEMLEELEVPEEYDDVIDLGRFTCNIMITNIFFGIKTILNFKLISKKLIRSLILNTILLD